MITTKGREMAVSNSSRIREMSLLNDERGVGMLVTRGNGDRFQTLSQFPDHGFSNRESDTTSKFQWNCLLNDTRENSVHGVVESGGHPNGVRNYDGLVARSLPVESDRTRNVPTYAPAVSVSEYPGRTRNGTGPPVEDCKNVRVRAREYLPRMETQMLRQPHDEGSGLKFRSEDSSCGLTPRSQSSGQHTPFRGISMDNLEGSRQEGLRHPADLFGSDGSVPLTRGNSHHRIPYSTAGASTPHFSTEGINYAMSDYIPNMGRPAGYMDPESQRFVQVYQNALPNDIHKPGDYMDLESQWSSMVYRNALPEHIYDNNYNHQNYNDQADVLDSASPRLCHIESSHRSIVIEDVLQSSSHVHHERLPTLADYDGGRSACENDETNVYLTNTYYKYERMPCEEHFSNETDAHGMLCEGQNLSSSTLEAVEYLLESGNPALNAHYRTTRKRKHGLVGKMSGAERRSSTFGGRGALSYENGQLSADNGKELGPSVRSIGYHDEHHVRSNIGVSKSDVRQPFAGLPEALQRRLSNSHESGKVDTRKRHNCPNGVPHSHASHLPWQRNAKSRVKASPQGIHTTSVVQKYGKVKGGSSKKKLKSAPRLVVCPPAGLDPQVSLPELNLKKQQKLAPMNRGDPKEVLCSQEADAENSILKVKPSEKESSEDSKEFRRQVDIWFLKSMEHLNAKIGRQKKFKEQGKAGSLKCIICSSSKEFVDTKDVAMHAFTSLKVGYRAPHLGFHRALCVLMGWDRAVAPNGRWVCQSLPEAEARTLKEDVIIWPPVVIIHSISARTYCHNEQVKVLINQLENILRDMGYSDRNTKVCRGKPGNLNVMVVKFSGTLTGLQEAERLHNAFAEKKHGRVELQQIDAGVEGCVAVDQEPVDTTEDAMYGYLGIIEDLDKLHFDMKPHYRARSKKEILASVESAT